MKKLFLYAIFHGNLQSSGIPTEKYSKILNLSYWPLLALVEEAGIPLGLEMPSYTLKIINDLDETYIKKLKRLWDKGKCEVIGSSYSQDILPLIPAEINEKNIKYGLEDYKKILGRSPITAFINEQAYSSGLVKLYKQFGYKNIFMEWNTAARENRYPLEYLYRPQTVIGTAGAKMNIIWDHIPNSHYFRNYLEGRLPISQYLDILKVHYSKHEDRVVPLVMIDWETINHDLMDRSMERYPGKSEEISRLRELVECIEKERWLELITPAEAVKRFLSKRRLRLESSSFPIYTGGSDTYNIVRWAVSGRDDTQINTQCHQLFEDLSQLEFLYNHDKRKNKKKLTGNWKELCLLWSSDLRTYTTDGKYLSFRQRMGYELGKINEEIKDNTKGLRIKGDFALLNAGPEDWLRDPYIYEWHFLPGEMRNFFNILIDDIPAENQIEEVEFYRDGSIRNAKIVITPFIKSGQLAQVRFLKKEKRINVAPKIKIDNFSIETPAVKLELLKDKGARISSLIFPQISSKPFIGSFEYDIYDYYSGDLQIKNNNGEISSDNTPATILTQLDRLSLLPYPIRIPIFYRIDMNLGKLIKIFYIYVNQPRVDLEYRFTVTDINPFFFRLGTMTLNYYAFSNERLRYCTVNGGKDIEKFSVKGHPIRHDSFIWTQPTDDMIKTTFSSTSCLGATEGWVDIGDEEKGISMITDKTMLYSVPLLRYEERDNSYLFQITNSIGETDDTGQTHWRGYNRAYFSYLGHKKGLDDIRRQTRCLNRKLLMIKKSGR